MSLLAATMSAFTTAGARIAPLRHLDDVAAFLLAAAAIAAGTHKRAVRIAARLGNVFSAPLIQALLDKIPSLPKVNALLTCLPPSHGMTLVTDRVTCVVCDGPLCDVADDISVPLYSANGIMNDVKLCSKRCCKCDASHYLSYAQGGTVLAESVQRPYPECTDARFFHITKSVVWERSVLVEYETQCFNSHTGFETFISEYTFKYGALPTSEARARMALSHVFYAWSFIRWRAELKMPSIDVRFGDAVGRDGELSAMDETLLKWMPDMCEAFTRRWGSQHDAGVCRNPESCTCQAVDGHVKARRRVCANPYARIRDCGSLGKLVLNCSHSPLPGSKFCRSCRDAAARSGKEGLVGAAGIEATNFLSQSACIPCDDEEPDGEQSVAAAYRLQRAKEAAAKGAAVEADEKDVWLVEELLDHKPATIAGQCKPSCSLGDGHRACVNKHKRRMFKVKWVGWGDSFNQWVCEYDVGREAVSEYDAARKEAAEGRRQKHAGSLAAACCAVAGGGSEDFVLKAADAKSFKELGCGNLKEFQYGERKHTSAGILALVSGCGLFLKIDEIYGAESITQLHYFLFEAYHKNGITKPKVLVYDDACHLLKFLQNRPNSILCRALLRGMEICCDRFHFPNHKSAWCKANVDPGKVDVPGFDKANTQAAEEAFAWLARSKHIFPNMNEAHFLFFMLRIAHLRNVQLCRRGGPSRRDAS